MKVTKTISKPQNTYEGRNGDPGVLLQAVIGNGRGPERDANDCRRTGTGTAHASQMNVATSSSSVAECGARVPSEWRENGTAL